MIMHICMKYYLDKKKCKCINNNSSSSRSSSNGKMVEKEVVVKI